jgi:aminopeptidase N
MFAKMSIIGFGLIISVTETTAANLEFNWTSPGDNFGGYHALLERFHRPGPSISSFDEADDSTGYDVIHYNLEIQFFPNHSVSGKVDMILVAEEALGAVNLNLRNNMVVDSVRVNGATVSHLFTGIDDLHLNLLTTLNPGDSATASLWYHGSPLPGIWPEAPGLNWDSHLGTAIIWSLSESEGARTWWPCKDIPSDKATARIVWTVPENLIATSNGLLQSVTVPLPGWKSYEWVENYPLTTYLVSVTATNFTLVRNWYVSTLGDSMPLDNYVYPEDSVEAIVSFSNLATMIEYYATIFGEYPFITEKYGHAAFPVWGAMEHQTLTSYGAWAIDGTHSYDWMIAHELSHQWWGDLITCETWADIWLNEGFATYSDALWAYYVNGWPGLWQRLAEFQTSYFYWDENYGRYPIYNPPPDLMWGATSYEKGGWVLHMLRGVIGETNFSNFWQVYREAYAPGNSPGIVNSAQMQQTAEQVSGQDLDWFFNEWIYQAGYPEYDWGWSYSTMGDSCGVWVSIVQTQSTAFQTSEVFIMPVPIRIITDMDTFNVIAQNDQRQQVFSFEVSGDSVLDVQFDPDNWILKTSQEIPFVGVEPEPPQAQPITQTLLKLGPNPANSSTVISYQLSAFSHVSIRVYDTAGRLIETLYEGQRPAGEYWQPFNGSKLASGMYLVRLETEQEQLTQKLVLLK